MIGRMQASDIDGLVDLAVELWPHHALRFHLATGFQEAGRIICFTKRL